MDKKDIKIFEKTIKKCKKEGLNPAIVAANNGDLEFLQYLDDKYCYSLRSQDNDGNNIAHIAIEKNDNGLLRFVIQNNPGLLYVFNQDGYSPIDLACKKYDINAINLLIDKHVDIHKALLIKRISSGNTVAHIAVYQNDIELLKRIEKIAPEIFTIKNDEFHTPLEIAWERDNKKAFRIASKHSPIESIEYVLNCEPEYFLNLATALFKDDRKNDLKKLKNTVIETVKRRLSQNPTTKEMKKYNSLLETMNNKIDYERQKISNKEKVLIKKNEKAKLERRLNKFIEK